MFSVKFSVLTCRLLVIGSAFLIVGSAIGQSGRTPEGKTKIDDPKPKKLTRMPDLPAELRALFAQWHATYRGQSEEKFLELEKVAAALIEKHPDHRASIYFEVAHVAGQSGSGHYERIEKYARKALELSRDPVQRGWLWMYLSCTAQDAKAAKTFSERRQLAAEALLSNYRELLVQDLPTEAPELLGITKPARFDEQRPGAPSTEELQRPQIEARREAEFIGELVSRRETLLTQLRDLYRPSVYSNLDADGPEELRELAMAKLKDQRLVDALLDRVTGMPKAKPEEPRGVKRVQGNLVLIAAGTNHGLRVGDLMEVYRMEKLPIHVGRLRIVAIDETEVTGKLTANENQEAKVGDLVTKTTPVK